MMPSFDHQAARTVKLDSAAAGTSKRTSQSLGVRTEAPDLGSRARERPVAQPFGMRNGSVAKRYILHVSNFFPATEHLLKRQELVTNPCVIREMDGAEGPGEKRDCGLVDA
jgi:hypothetical protein